MGTEGRRIYVGGLPYRVDERELRDLCDKYGRIEDGECLNVHHPPFCVALGFMYKKHNDYFVLMLSVHLSKYLDFIA